MEIFKPLQIYTYIYMYYISAYILDEGLEDEVDGEEGETYEFTEDDVIIQEEEVIPTEQIVSYISIYLSIFF